MNSTTIITSNNVNISTPLFVLTVSTASYKNMSGELQTGENDIVRFTECDWNFTSCRVQQYLFLVLAPLLVIIATVGNSLGLAVMTSKTLRKSGTAMFISALAISDTIAVWTGLSRHFVYKLTKYDIRQYTIWSCRFQRFFLYTSLDTSTWILAAVTVERFLAVCVPHKHQLLKTAERALIVVIGIVIFQTGFNMHVFFNYGEQEITKNNETRIFPCAYISDSARLYLTEYNGWIAFAIYCVIPFLVMIILNAFIIRRLIQMQKIFSNTKTQSIMSIRRQNSTISMTKMLLSVTFYFIVITTPSFIFQSRQDSLLNRVRVTPEGYADSEVVDAVLTLLLYLNHSMNFFLYCLTGKKFKRELKRILPCGQKNTKYESNFLTTSETKVSVRELFSRRRSVQLQSTTLSDKPESSETNG